MNANLNQDAIFYHIYPLGLCGAPNMNNLDLPVVNRLDILYPWVDHIKALGVNAVYLGPVFQSTSHGYDTIDYYQVDKRLGDNGTLARFADYVHQNGMRLIFDAVFNHVGRDFWAFKDLLQNKEKSAYRDWFYNLRFGEKSPKGDPFNYDGWQGHYSLVKLNLANQDVRDHIFNAVGTWIDEYKIDGLRLDAADCIDIDFLQALRQFTKSRKSEFWLMGEVVHGDYRDWVNDNTLDSVTNYACYKGLYSSLNDANYFEIAHGLNQQFGDNGQYRGLLLYNFVDNHDVDRIASKLAEPAHLYPVYILLLTMPGIPSVYYGSEWGIPGVKEKWTDAPLRPAIDLDEMKRNNPHPNLSQAISRLIQIRHNSEAIRVGNYKELFVDRHQFAFLRQADDEQVLIALNSDDKERRIHIQLSIKSGILIDQLNQGDTFALQEGQVRFTIPPHWGRILKIREDEN